MKRLQNLTEYGSLMIEPSGDKISLVFMPDETKIRKTKTATVQFRREALEDAVAALEEYFNSDVSWKDYPATYFDPDYIVE